MQIYLYCLLKVRVRVMRIAVIGSGISGLASGFLLQNHADVHLFESAGRIGGHCNTVDAHFGDVSVPVDTGFIVYNPLNYPNLMSLFAILSIHKRVIQIKVNNLKNKNKIISYTLKDIKILNFLINNSF